MAMLVPPAVVPGSMSTQEQPTLAVDDGVELRPWRVDDAPYALVAFADPEIQRWHFRSMTTTIEAAEWIAAMAVGWRSESAGTWAIARPGGDAVLGRISFYVRDLQSGLGEVTYWVLPDARGEGLASRAADRVATWALDEVGFHRVEVRHSTQNVASCRTAERAGFVGEGVLREALLHADGWHDVHLHGRVAPPAP